MKDRYDEKHLMLGDGWESARFRRPKSGFTEMISCQIEGWGLAAAAVVAAGAAAYSSASSSSAQQDALNAASHQPGVVPYNPPDVSQGYTEYAQLAQDQLPALNKQTAANNAYDNAQFQGQLSKTDPYLLGNIVNQGQNAEIEQSVARQELKGRLPKDVIANVARSSAYQALSGGYAGSDAASANAARSLGLTSLDLVGKGSVLQGAANQTVGANLAADSAINPYNATGDSLLMTPQQLLARDDQNAAIASAEANKNAQISFGNSLNAQAANSISPVSNAVVSGIGSLASSYIGGATGGASSSFSRSGTGSIQGNYTVPGSNTYDVSSSLATNNGIYNPYADSLNYDPSGQFYGNPYSYGAVGGVG